MSALNGLTNERLMSIKMQGLPEEKKYSTRFFQKFRKILHGLDIAD